MAVCCSMSSVTRSCCSQAVLSASILSFMCSSYAQTVRAVTAPAAAVRDSSHGCPNRRCGQTSNVGSGVIFGPRRDCLAQAADMDRRVFPCATVARSRETRCDAPNRISRICFERSVTATIRIQTGSFRPTSGQFRPRNY
jgi:hypothetical protein